MQAYRCVDCEFDQYFQDLYIVHAVVTPVEVPEVIGFKVPQGYYFHRGHTWVKVEEASTVRVGLDDFALRVFGPLDRIEAPLMGKEVRRDRADISIHRGPHGAGVFSPVDGVVTDVNVKLREEGRLANEDPYSGGWIMRVHCNHLRKDLKKLMIDHESLAFAAAQAERLYETIEELGGGLSADGGFLGCDIYGSMPQLGWKRLAKRFLGGA
jgi:glycine cleavage system H lipoate-binding protein